MSDEKRRLTKTVPVSLRIDPKTKFILDFVARIKGQTVTTVVERAIKDMADRFRLGASEHDQNNKRLYDWCAFWDTSEGVRTLKLISCKDYPTTFEEEEIKEFTYFHQLFFYIDNFRGELNRSHVYILWPKIDEYIEIWRETKARDHWAAGQAMNSDLAAAGVAGPHWPPLANPDLQPEPPIPRET